jgi:hypothetical protein
MATSTKAKATATSTAGSTAGSTTQQAPKEEVKSKGILESASNIVLKAAGILEEEIAKGILAARELEGKLTDVPRLRSGQSNPDQRVDDLFLRFRKDAHDIIDLVVDLASVAAQNAGKVSSGLMRITTCGSTSTTGASSGSGAKPAPPAAPPQIPLIQVPQDLHPGEEASFPVTLENDSTKEEKNIVFLSSPFTDAEGKQLSASALRFNPNPLLIPISSKATVEVTVSIPKNAKKGSYTSFVQGKDMESLKASVMVKVV